MEYQSIINSPELIDSLSEVNLFEDYNVISVNNKTIFAKSFNQSRFIKMMIDNQITFAIGPAGTGKTFLAIAFALSQITSGEKQKIILTRPVVEAGENLGFLPGTLSEKLSPYVRPLYDAMEWMLPPSIINKLEANGAIEVAPLAYMRGRSLHNSIIILDEAQNTTIEQMKMFLTRIGENSKSIITGDITQIDLPRGHRSGLVHANDILRDINGMDFVEFTSKDVVRAKIVQKIIDAYAKDYSNGQ
jgi:phosphate starvation-inducible PhoH-like protein